MAIPTLHKDARPLNQKQIEASELISNDKRYTMLYGGGGSGKSFIFCISLIWRCLLMPNSTHGVFRETAVSLKNSIFNDTMRHAMRAVDPELLNPNSRIVRITNDPMEIHFYNGSKILFAGLDSDDRIERLLGMEYTTVWINEVSQIKTYSPVVSTLIMRLRQPNIKVGYNNAKGEFLPQRDAKFKFWFDCNPPPKSHWAHKRFILKEDDDGNALRNPDQWQSLMMNTVDNLDIMGEDYLNEMIAGMSEVEARRMVYGEFLDDNSDSLFPLDIIAKYRHRLSDDPAKAADEIKRVRSTMARVVIAVDPATTDHKSSDMTGISVCGVDEQGHAYVFEDATMKGRPEQWAGVVAKLWEKWGASLVVAEDNQGGQMVEHTLNTVGIRAVKRIHARDGKRVRAQPVSLEYEKGRVHHVGQHQKLERQMEGYGLDYNYTKRGSPDRMDALVYAITELICKKPVRPNEFHITNAGGFWR